ncbi:MAG: radical SAM protein [Nitrospirae bacterium]|nr:radical SAM protein [Nitrospirota bacterium]
MKRFAFDIDVTGSCNLRCPSCPQGNVRDYRLDQGFMEPELLARIIRKAGSECRIAGIGLFNWAEPMLHPGLPELVRIVQNAGVSCYLSSNLNIMRNADAVMAADPFSFRISASGFTQEVYGRTHRGGDIERVKKHMVELAEAKKRNKASTRIYVYYHRYKHNLKEEPLMREFAAGLGFGFQPVWALMFPVEKVLCYADGDNNEFPLTGEDRQLIDSLALPLKKALETSRRRRERTCSLRDSQISMDFRGNVQLCCGIYHAGKFTLGNYLDMSLDEIRKLREGHSLCGRCMRHGAHVYVTYGAHELEEIAAANIDPEDAELLDLSYELAQKRLRRRLEEVYRRVFAGIITTEQKAALGSVFDRLQRIVGRLKRPRP